MTAKPTIEPGREQEATPESQLIQALLQWKSTAERSGNDGTSGSAVMLESAPVFAFAEEANAPVETGAVENFEEPVMQLITPATAKAAQVYALHDWNFFCFPSAYQPHNPSY